MRTPLIPCFNLRVRNADSISNANRAGTTILLVEQNARMALLIANRGFVLETGRVMLSDTATNLLANEEMNAHYLGAHNHIKEARKRRLD